MRSVMLFPICHYTAHSNLSEINCGHITICNWALSVQTGTVCQISYLLAQFHNFVWIWGYGSSWGPPTLPCPCMDATLDGLWRAASCSFTSHREWHQGRRAAQNLSTGLPGRSGQAEQFSALQEPSWKATKGARQQRTNLAEPEA